MSLLGVPTEIVQNELNEQTQLIIRHSACKLISAEPMFDGLAKNVDIFNEFLTKRLGTDNPKRLYIVQSIKRFMKAHDNGSLPNDSEQSMLQLANLNIYIQFYKSMQRFCDLFYLEPNVHNEQILREVFGTLCAFIRTIIRQFSEYCKMAQKDGFDQMKADICR
uniref:tRNA exportin n=1 Tax=Globodera pallida TaxID=36090 RepID=A0A183BZC7_GLOPA